jgi:short-subunit dehydrogenase
MGTALVTGGTAGIGHAFARRLAADGYDLVLVARDGERLAQVAAELGARYGVRVEVLVADLAVRADVARVADRLRSAPVDVLVNNAGFGLNTSFLTGDVADQERMLDVLCRAVLVLSHAGATAMVARGSGAIVNVSSVAGFVAMGTYGAAKAWVTAFTEALAVELAGTGVTATVLCPGFVRTQFHGRARMNMSRLPARAWLDADEVVDACLADVRRGRVVSVPSARYRAVVLLARHAPRSLVRRVSNGLSRRRR